MLQIGKTQDLTLARLTSVGAYLTDGTDDVLLPNKYVPHHADLGQSIRVFLYLDSEDRPVATTRVPKAEADMFAVLRCISVGPIGAFMDIGLEKDLLVPFREQLSPMVEGKSYVIRVYLDSVSKRLVGSARLKRFVEVPPELPSGQPVRFLVAELRPRMLWGIADNKYAAVALEDELDRTFRVGQELNGWVKRSTEEGLSLALRPIGRTAEMTEADALVKRLRQEEGFLGLNDDSNPDQIRRVLGLSKSTFKRVIGHLLKQGIIDIEPYGIRLREEFSESEGALG